MQTFISLKHTPAVLRRHTSCLPHIHLGMGALMTFCPALPTFLLGEMLKQNDIIPH